MASIEKIIEALSELTPEKVEKDLLAIIQKNEAQLVDYNIQQMLAGKKSDGSAISPEYTPLTVQIKKAKGQPHDRVTLRDEGDFQRDMFADTKQFPVEIHSQNWKEDKLVQKYGEKIFDLDAENTEEFVQDAVKQDVLEYFRKVI